MHTLKTTFVILAWRMSGANLAFLALVRWANWPRPHSPYLGRHVRFPANSRGIEARAQQQARKQHSVPGCGGVHTTFLAHPPIPIEIIVLHESSVP